VIPNCHRPMRTGSSSMGSPFRFGRISTPRRILQSVEACPLSFHHPRRPVPFSSPMRDGVQPRRTGGTRPAIWNSTNCRDILVMTDRYDIEDLLTVGTLGELERSVMDAIWVHADGLSAAELREVLSDRDLALTTVHTVLSRLETKGLVTRDRRVRPHRYLTVSTREAHVVERLTEM